MWIVIGIGGVTGGGKTTLTNSLCETLPSDVKCLTADNYFFEKKDPRHKWILMDGVLRINYEMNSSINVEKIHWEIEAVMAPPSTKMKFLLVDGHTILNHPPIASLCHLRYYFTLPRDECMRRRRYPDKPGYFDAAVWPTYLAHKADVEDRYRDGVRYLDGTVDPEETLKIVKIDILNEILKINSRG